MTTLDVGVCERDGHETCGGLFAHPAFYAEFAPTPRHDAIIDHLYVLKDCGRLTADRRAFASPFGQIAFVFRTAPEGGVCAPQVAVARPRFGHRKRNRPFHGWMFGARIQPSVKLPSPTDSPSVARVQRHLAQVMAADADGLDLLAMLDRLADDLACDLAPGRETLRFFDIAQRGVAQLADQLGRSARTLHRQARASTGLPPARLLATNRFHRAVYEVATQKSKLAFLASDLGFADQAHLSREFRKHAGLSPAAFKHVWQGARGQAVRFVQDPGSPTRLRVAVWAPCGRDETDISNLGSL